MNTPDSGFRRKMLTLERRFFRAPGANLSVVARIRGEIAQDKLRSALTKLRQMHPLLGVRVVLDSHQDAWFSSDGVTELQLKVIPRDSDDQWMKVVQEEHSIAFDFEKGPLVRVILLKSPELSDLIIFCQHTICDGISLANLTRDTLLCISEPERELSPETDTPLPIPDNFPIDFSGNKLTNIIKKKIAERMNEKWRRDRVIFNEEDFRNIHRAYFKTYQYRIVTAELSEVDVLSLIDVCRQNQVTVNSAIGVAFLAGRHDVIGKYANNIQNIAVNVRNRLKRSAEYAFGLFAVGVDFRLGYNPEKPFWDSVRSFNKRVKHIMDIREDLQRLADHSKYDATLIEGIKFAAHVRLAPSEFDRNSKLSAFSNNDRNVAVMLAKMSLSRYPGLVVTNLGSLNYPTKYGPLELEKLFFPSPASPFQDATLTMGVVTVGGKLTITLNFMVLTDHTINSRVTLMENIKESAIGHLIKAMGR